MFLKDICQMMCTDSLPVSPTHQDDLTFILRVTQGFQDSSYPYQAGSDSELPCPGQPG